MAKQRDGERELRAQQLEKVGAYIQGLEDSKEAGRIASKQLVLLESVSLGLYDEVDKLTKKAPSEAVTDLSLGQLNDVIRETKDLVSEDPYVQRLSEFVPAGNNPQHRDAVMVLRQVREGLKRYQVHLTRQQEINVQRLDLARLLRVVLEMHLEDGGKPIRSDIEDRMTDISIHIAGSTLTAWMVRGDSYDHDKYEFNFAKLDNLDMEQHLAPE